MADKFTGGVDTPTNLQFGANEFVDTSNPLEALPGAAKALAEGTGVLATRSAQAVFDDQASAERDYYTKSREAKQGLWEASLPESRDDEAVAKYSQQLIDLKIAEKQGLISGSNSQIRQETILKQTINRFPHREEEIRRMYSSTRARAALEREQFKDPIEEGVDQMVTRAYAAGRTPAQQLDFERAAEGYTVFKQNAEMRATLGTDLQNEFSEMIDKQYSTMAFAEVSNWLGWASKAFQTDKTMTIEMAKGQFEKVKSQILLGYQATVNGIVRNSANPDAVLSRDFVTSKRSEVAKMLDDQVSQINSMDQLVAKQRMMEWGKQLGYEKLMKYDPLIAWMVTSNPEKGAAFVFEDWDKTEHIMRNAGVSELNVLIQNSTGADKTRLQFQRDMILGWNGLSQSEYFDDMLGKGVAPPTTGMPEVDASRTNAVVASTLNSRNSTPEMKTNAAKAALDVEKKYSKPGEYVGPSAVWYKDPARRNALRSDPQFQEQMKTEVENSAANLIQNITDAGAASSISYSRQAEFEPTDKPWSLYTQGGPFVSTQADVSHTDKLNTTMLVAGDLRKAVLGLNHMFWIKTVMEGGSAADQWAMTVLREAEQVEKENKEAAEAEAEKKKKKAEAK